MVVTGAMSSVTGVAGVGTVTVLLRLAVFAGFDWCFDVFLAIFVRLYSFISLSFVLIALTLVTLSQVPYPKFLSPKSKISSTGFP